MDFFVLLFLIIDITFYNHTEGQLNDQFSQLGLNNSSSLPPVQNINLVSVFLILILFSNFAHI